MTISTSTNFSALAQDIVPRTDIITDDEETRTGVVSYVDTSGLGEGMTFYQAASLDIQLLEDDTIFNVKNTFAGAETYFYGESDDNMVALSLMRYTPKTPKSGALENVLTGILHDRQRNLFYEIRQDEQQRQLVRITSEDDIPPTADPLLSSSSSFPPLWKQLTTSTPFMSTMYNRISHYFFSRGATPRNGAVYIDVMVIWTESTECYHSSLETGCPVSDTTRTNMEAVVDLMIAETNTALANSATGMLLRLAHRQRESSGYIESVGMRNTLGQISQIQCIGNQLNYIHTLRDNHKADLVQFIVDNRIDPDGLGGIAYLPRTNSLGFYDTNAGYSVVCAQCMMNYVSAHEFGHNLGCNHDRGTANACITPGLPGCGGSNVVGISRTNYGYRSPTASFRTIMSYRCRTGQCDNNPGGACPRVPYFSGDAYYPPNRESLGGTDNSCRTEIERMKFHIANYRNC